MNDMFVPSSRDRAPAGVLDRLATQLNGLTPELRKAASYLLDNPNDIGIGSIPEMAEAARVKPNTFVRMAFVIADADPEVIANIERFHQRRHELGIYWSEED